MDREYRIGTRAFRQLIITAGFLPGLWIYIGVDPRAQVDIVVIDIIVKYISALALSSNVELSWWAHFFYDIQGYLAAGCTWVFVYMVGGGWGFLATLLAFFSGIFVTSFGIWLFIIVWLISPWLPLGED